MTKSFWAMLALIVLSILGSLVLETEMRARYDLELFLILISLFVAVIIFIGLASEKKWGWPLSVVFFSAVEINALWVYFSTKMHLLVFSATIVVALIGFILSILNLKRVEGESCEETGETTAESVEPEYLEPEKYNTEYAKPKSARGRPRKK